MRPPELRPLSALGPIAVTPSIPSRPTTIRGRHWHIACAVPQAACQALIRQKVGSALGITLAVCTVSRKRHRKAPQTVRQRYQQLSSRLYRCAVVPFVLLVPESRALIARGAKQTARLNEHSRIPRKPSSGELGRGRDPRGEFRPPRILQHTNLRNCADELA